MPVIANHPVDGHYQIRLVKAGPFVPVRIWTTSGEPDAAGVLTSDQIIKATADGDDVDVFDVWPYCAGEPIEENEYLFMTERIQWDRDHAPSEPGANPRRRIDFHTTKPVF